MSRPALEHVQVEEHGAVALVRINRPEASNALSRAAAAELRAAVDWVAGAAHIRAIVLTGAGQRAFCAGADLKERRQWLGREYEARRPVVRLRRALRQLPKPVVMGVNGHAVGGGFEILLLADAVIASDQAQFWLPEVGWGGMPGGWSTQLLPRVAGPVQARWIILSGQRLSAAEAHALRLVTEVVPAQRVVTRSLEVARRLAELPPAAVAMAKEAVRHAVGAPLSAGVAMEDHLLETVAAAPEVQVEPARPAGRGNPQRSKERG